MCKNLNVRCQPAAVDNYVGWDLILPDNSYRQLSLLC